MAIPMNGMRRIISVFLLFSISAAAAAASRPEKEFLTDKEIDKIQDSYAIDVRVRIYMEAAALRLKTAEERLTGKESAPGDPLEFFTPEDMMAGYYRIIKSVMTNLDDAAQYPERNNGIIINGETDKNDSRRIGKALKILKSETEKSIDELVILKKIAEEKKKEELWNLVNSAIDITHGAHEGAVYGLSKQPPLPDKNTKSK